MTPTSRWTAALAAACLLPAPAAAQRQAAGVPARSAPLANLRYEVTFDSASASRRTLKVVVSFDVGGPGPVLLSFPSWTPGSYELANFARFVGGFTAVAGEQAARLGQVRLRHLADRSGGRPDGHRALRLPGGDARQCGGVEPAGLRLLQRHQHLPLSRGPGVRLRCDGRGQDPARLAGRDRDAARGVLQGSYRGGQLSRPGGQAVLRRPDRPRQHAGGGQVAPPGHLSRRRDGGPRPRAAVGPDREDGAEDGRGVPGDAVDDLHHAAGVHPEVGGGARWSTPTLTSASTTRGSSATRCWPRSPTTRSSTRGT